MKKLGILYNEVESILLSESINKRGKIHKIVNESFINTPFYNNLKFVNESARLLGNGENAKFLVYVNESEELFQDLINMCVLTFSTENSKLGGSIATFSLPAGWSCPFAKACEKRVDRDRKMDPDKEGTYKISKKTGKKIPYKGDVQVTKGKHAEYDCYAASMEQQYDDLREKRWQNFDLLKAAESSDEQADLIVKSLTYFFDSEGKKDTVRIHESGDFYSGEYLQAWINVAKRMPSVTFYAYTKSLPFVKKLEKDIGGLPNFIITLSDGGHRDKDLDSIDIKEAKVFESPEELYKAGLMLDLDDKLSREKLGKEGNFGLLVHGTQEAGEKQQFKLRNETFQNYWKYRCKVMRRLRLSGDHPSLEDAKRKVKELTDIKNNLSTYNQKFNTKYTKTTFDFELKIMRYVVKYYKYNFPTYLEKIIQDKYKKCSLN
jgi:hypothetical protein